MSKPKTDKESRQANLIPWEPYTPPHKSAKTNYPYITGFGFRSLCDFIFDSDVRNLEAGKVEPGDIIFVSHDCLKDFFTLYRPNIKNPFILVTHHFIGDGDASTPGPYASYLDDELLLAWFAANIDSTHPKVKALPLGLPNSFYDIGNIEVYEYHIKKFRHSEKTGLLYSNFNLTNCPAERRYVHDLFADKRFCTTVERTTHADYLKDVARHKFILSPRGNGLDCYRTWETLLMGSIPVVRSSTLDPLYDDLPVVIIQEWEEVTEEFLERRYKEIMSNAQHYNFAKLYFPYWCNEILAYKYNAKLTYSNAEP